VADALLAALRARVRGFEEEAAGGVAIIQEALADMRLLEAAGPRFSADAPCGSSIGR